MQIRAWRLTGDNRDVNVQPTNALPGTVWDALQGGALAGAIAAGPKGTAVLLEGPQTLTGSSAWG